MVKFSKDITVKRSSLNENTIFDNWHIVQYKDIGVEAWLNLLAKRHNSKTVKTQFF